METEREMIRVQKSRCVDALANVLDVIAIQESMVNLMCRVVAGVRPRTRKTVGGVRVGREHVVCRHGLLSQLHSGAREFRVAVWSAYPVAFAGGPVAD